MCITNCISFLHVWKSDWCSANHFSNTPLSCSQHLLQHWCAAECCVCLRLQEPNPRERGCLAFWGMIYVVIRGICLNNYKKSRCHKSQLERAWCSWLEVHFCLKVGAAHSVGSSLFLPEGTKQIVMYPRSRERGHQTLLAYGAGLSDDFPKTQELDSKDQFPFESLCQRGTDKPRQGAREPWRESVQVWGRICMKDWKGVLGADVASPPLHENSFTYLWQCSLTQSLRLPCDWTGYVMISMSGCCKIS